MFTKVISHCPLKLLFMRNLSNFIQSSTSSQRGIARFSQDLSCQNSFSLSKSNFWCRKIFSAAQPTSSESATLVDDIEPSKAGKFSLSKLFLSKYKDVIPPFGFNGLGEIVYRRTYSRLKEDGEKELWWETIERVVNGTFNIQKRWIEQNGLTWDSKKAQGSAQSMYDKIFNMKFLPPGRGLWAMGSPLTEERHLFSALNNCAFVSTEKMFDGSSSISTPFTFLLDASMLGVGVGFDTKGANSAGSKFHVILGPNTSRPHTTYFIEDSREGWVKSVGMLIDSYFYENAGPYKFNYSQIRPPGLSIKGFGGITSGAEPLIQLHTQISRLLSENIGKPLNVTIIVDIMNLIGKCVVTGNVRRVAEIAFGDPSDNEYINLKNYDINPHRSEYGWTSNNSVSFDYTTICEQVRKNGEPGFAWLDNARAYSRMCDPPDHKDIYAQGGNPCLEQTLESYELCCLVETFPTNHTSLDDFLDTLYSAFLYAKTVTLERTHWSQSNAIMLRNRRIGCGLSGIAQFISQRGLAELKTWCEEGYKHIQNVDKEISKWFCIPKSIKTTTIKPSGTVSLLAGATPGMHYPESRYCIRRVRLSKHSELIDPLKKIGFKIEQDVVESSSLVVEIPIDHGEGIRSLKELSMWEQLSLAAFLQKYWSDNQVSCTVTFDPETEGPQLKYALDYFQYQLKGISFLPRMPLGAYAQMPIEAISSEQYENIISSVLPQSTSTSTITGAKQKNLKVDFQNIQSKVKSDPEIERYCDTNTCS
ncbi:18262_t:CDS:10 [Funneliformis geosporum]|uniref:ribonucleoside-triphosphate reductase (thioredoxin) n=1 Tax=Funneliformis geosporum TaxID=1117311 RepID=A0A9W4WJK7_9GLOM|nr:17038_t:CDS:10 [Funneliformis geosporum]CAI2168399.1 18262_t:CDS:10 [Funneliformis geosporum]